MELGAKLMVMRSTRNDPLANLHARKSIDEAQYAGGRAFQQDFETAERGPKAIDPSQPYVDCSRVERGISAAISKALDGLTKARDELGQNGGALMHDFLIEGLNVVEIGIKRGMVSELELKYLGKRVRECLESLAIVYGYAMQCRRSEKPLISLNNL
jgi:hypothetical protein